MFSKKALADSTRKEPIEHQQKHCSGVAITTELSHLVQRPQCQMRKSQPSLVPTVCLFVCLQCNGGGLKTFFDEEVETGHCLLWLDQSSDECRKD
jgi:hypothetical protein